LQQDRIPEAIALAQDALGQVVGSAPRKYYPRLEAEASLRLGEAQRRAGDPGGARPNLERALHLRAENDDPASPWLAEAQIALAACLVDLGERRQAAVLLAKAGAIQAAHHELGRHFIAPRSELAARLAPR
jgi:tetratricopeptide (TPR) repeat protein